MSLAFLPGLCWPIKGGGEGPGDSISAVGRSEDRMDGYTEGDKWIPAVWALHQAQGQGN